MADHFDVVVVSGFERGIWTAQQLSSKGLKVALIDVTGQLGLSRPSEWEGPFGFFADPRMTPSQMDFMASQSLQEVSPGMVIWPQSGPIELRGPTRDCRFNGLGLSSNVIQMLSSGAEGRERAREMMKQRDVLSTFDQHWLLAFGFNFSNVVMDPFHEGVTGELSPLLARYYVRRYDEGDSESRLQWVESEKVKVFRNHHIIDLGMEGRRLSGIEIKGDRSGIVKCDRVIWCLTSAETQRCLPEVYSNLYDAPPIRPEWIWTQYGFEIESTEITKEWPARFVLLEDLNLPWTHGNYIILQNDGRPSRWSAWIRRPNNQRFQKSYIELMAENIREVLSQRSLGSQVETKLYPLEIEIDEHILGPPRFPVFSAKEFAKLSPRRLRNVFFDSYEQSGSHSISDTILGQSALTDSIYKLWNKERLKKEAKRDSTIPAT